MTPSNVSNPIASLISPFVESAGRDKHWTAVPSVGASTSTVTIASCIKVLCLVLLVFVMDPPTTATSQRRWFDTKATMVGTRRSAMERVLIVKATQSTKESGFPTTPCSPVRYIWRVTVPFWRIRILSSQKEVFRISKTRSGTWRIASSLLLMKSLLSINQHLFINHSLLIHHLILIHHLFPLLSVSSSPPTLKNSPSVTAAATTPVFPHSTSLS